MFLEIAQNHDFEIDTMEVAQDHVHIFLSFPPRYSISRVVGMLKSISASVVFRDHPEVKRELWGGEFWEDGYFARTVGDKVTAEVIRKYIRYHREEEKEAKAVGVVLMPRLVGGVIHWKNSERGLRNKYTTVLQAYYCCSGVRNRISVGSQGRNTH